MSARWEAKLPSTAGYFKRRIRWLHISLRDIRVIRFRGDLVWNFAEDTRGFKFLQHSLLTWVTEYQRYNGVDHLP